MYLSRVKDIVPLKRFCEGKFTQKICVSRLENLQNSVQFVYPSFARFEKCFLTCIQKNKCS